MVFFLLGFPKKNLIFQRWKHCLPKRAGCLIILLKYYDLAKVKKQRGNDWKLLQGAKGRGTEKSHKLSPLNWFSLPFVFCFVKVTYLKTHPCIDCPYY